MLSLHFGINLNFWQIRHSPIPSPNYRLNSHQFIGILNGDVGMSPAQPPCGIHLGDIRKRPCTLALLAGGKKTAPNISQKKKKHACKATRGHPAQPMIRAVAHQCPKFGSKPPLWDATRCPSAWTTGRTNGGVFVLKSVKDRVRIHRVFCYSNIFFWSGKFKHLYFL